MGLNVTQQPLASYPAFAGKCSTNPRVAQHRHDVRDDRFLELLLPA